MNQKNHTVNLPMEEYMELVKKAEEVEDPHRFYQEAIKSLLEFLAQNPRELGMLATGVVLKTGKFYFKVVYNPDTSGKYDLQITRKTS